MTEITPRFFVVPLFALAVIAALPRPASSNCQTQAAPSSGIVRLDIVASHCSPANRQVVMIATDALMR